MATIRATRTELVWPGKRAAEGNRREVPRVSPPFQMIERFNESCAARGAENAPAPDRMLTAVAARIAEPAVGLTPETGDRRLMIRRQRGR